MDRLHTNFVMSKKTLHSSNRLQHGLIALAIVRMAIEAIGALTKISRPLASSSPGVDWPTESHLSFWPKERSTTKVYRKNYQLELKPKKDKKKM